MAQTETKIDDIMPSAAPSDDEIRRWQVLPRDEQHRRLQKAIDAGFNSGISTRSIDEIISDAHQRVTAPRNG